MNLDSPASLYLVYGVGVVIAICSYFFARNVEVKKD